jgi:hypothetical protein
MHRVNWVVGANLHEAQCDFHFGQRTMHAMFVMCQLLNMAQRNKDTQLHFAFIDLTKAYDWVNQQALWCILHAYQVPSKIN